MRDMLDLGSWCILRMASADTLRVASSLEEAGFEVWTPTEPRIGRERKTRARCDKQHPIMPSYVFAKVEHVEGLLREALVPGRKHAPFNVMRYRGGIPLISERQLDPLRREQSRLEEVFERAKRRVTKAPKIERGTEIQMPAGAFEGLSGIVEDQQGQFTLVNIDVMGKTTRIKVQSLLLAEAPCDSEENLARDALPTQAKAA